MVSKSHFSKTILLSFVLLFLISCSNNDKPNIIFIITDDMYPEMFNVNFDKGDSLTKPNLTPAIDRLAKEGVWIENMKVVSPVCTPSRYNCLTGNYASRATNRATLNSAAINEGQQVIQWNNFIVPGKDKTMGTYFKEMGYTTGFVGKNHIIESVSQIGEEANPELDADPNTPKVKEGLEYRYKQLQEDIKQCGFDYADALYHNNPDWLGIKALASHNMDWITQKGLSFIEENKEGPFLLYMATTIPHGPLHPFQSWGADRRITPRGILKESPDVLPEFNGTLSEIFTRQIEKDSGLEKSLRNFVSINRRLESNKIKGKNKANLLWLDDALNALFKKLEKEELLENTIIVFFNDHGQDQKGTLYEGGINSQAFIWKKGGFKVGNVLKSPVSNVDFLPTLLELAGNSKHKDDFDGYSFIKALEGKEYTERPYMYHELGYARAIVKDGFKYYTIRYPDWANELSYEDREEMLKKHNAYKVKYGRPIVNAEPCAPFGHLVMIPGGELLEAQAMNNMPYYQAPDQFYDLINDPDEQHNLIDDPRYASKIKELKTALRQELEKLPGTYDL